MSGRYHSYDKGSSRSTRDDSRQYRERREGRERRRSRSRSPRRWSPPGRRRSRDRSTSRERDYKDTRHTSDYEEVVPAPPPPPRITKISIDFNKPKAPPIKMNLGGPAMPAAPKVKPTIASVFNADDDEDEPEEMPAEARMRMRNIGRETPTSAGPNSFGKTKQGFCDAKKVFEKNLKHALDMADKPGVQKLPQTIYKIKDHLASSEHELHLSPARPWDASNDASMPPPPPLPPQLHETTASDAEHVFAISFPEATQRNTDAIPSTSTALTSPVRSTQSYLISNFDPSINDINTWCEEVDRAKILNNWDDVECISRIRCCLKGDASSWLDQWNTYNRTWSNFKTEFNPLCPRKPDVADILFEVLSTDSDKFPSYVDYARRSLLMLRTVKGLSDELISAIVVRGITDPKIRALATNAKLPPEELVQFFSFHVKPNLNPSTDNKGSNATLPKRLLKSNDINASPAVPLKKKKIKKYRCHNCFEYNHCKKDCPMEQQLKCTKCRSTTHPKEACPMKINELKPNPLSKPINSNITIIEPNDIILEGTKNPNDKVIDGIKNPDDGIKERTKISNDKIIEGTKKPDDEIIEATRDPSDKIIGAPNDKIIKDKKIKNPENKRQWCSFCKCYDHTIENCLSKKECDICKKTGHPTSKCFLLKKKSKLCNFCKNFGHVAKHCPVAKTKPCEICKNVGHKSVNCFLAANRKPKCDFCMGQGHEAAKCFKKNRLPQVPAATCRFCKKPGHTDDKCVAKLSLSSSLKNLNSMLGDSLLT